MFITIEDETGIANLVVWVKAFETFRRVVLGSGMLGVYGRIEREVEVVHLVAHRLTDLSAELGSVGDRDASFPLPHGHEFHRGAPAPDPRGLPQGRLPRDIVDPYLHLDQIKVKTRDFM
ncbi:DNA-binding protein [Ensifer adhaerens]|uniref:DNA-binding protein n=1 Tax=Ensifer adhaerens TaxID=106592 RepID=UPI003F852A07